MIIDSHMHLGHDYVFDVTIKEKDIVDACNKFGVDYGIVQPLISRPYIEDTIQIHNKICKMVNKYNGRFFGLASINPHFKPEDYDKELTRCVKDLNFVGVKITPIGHAANPSSKDCMHVYEIAASLDIPVMIHTGSGTPFADPVAMIDAVKAFPNVRFIVSHAGSDLMFKQAIYLVMNYDNVYLEPSWIGIDNIIRAIKDIGANRIMFSSDVPENIPVELEKYKNATKDKKELDYIFSGTAIEVFKLNLLKKKNE